MIIYYVRHAEPIYNPDCLTEFGKKQAESLSNRLSKIKFDKIYVSTSNRAKETLQPTLDKTGERAEELDWANEGHAWHELSCDVGKGKSWAFIQKDFCLKMNEEKVVGAGKKWAETDEMKQFNFQQGLDRIDNDTDNFLKELGFIHDRKNNRYKVNAKDEKKVLFVAHQGFGLAFLASMLDIPYNIFSTHFDLELSSISVILFSEDKEYCIPKILQLSNDSHLYKDGPNTIYNGFVEI